MMNIVIIHTGFAKYLVYTLKKLKTTNKNASIFLISDREYKEYSQYSTFVDIKKVTKEEAITFKNKYIHLGKSDPNYEMFCMQRWIILKDFMKEYNINECFHIDSDVLLFSDLNEVLKPFVKYDISLANKLALTMYIRNIKVLEEFSKYLLFKYTDEKEINKLKSMYYDDPNRLNNGVAGSISDMDISREFFSQTNFQVGNLSEIENDSIFDFAILYGSPNFEMLKKDKYEMKKIYFENDIPFCNYSKDGINKKIRFHSLHFLVWTKPYMKKLANNIDLNFNPYYINIYRELTVFKNKIKKLFN
ncbi:hypothetical protein [uncultured Brachyspira sp.]|uniref:hypothetical protein n=1 Tax=uncultured Brachyspira sp. TaxID=221953 RepID=UPI00262B6342|nr:hypothetical protein [uncultured Brachyspira sp.]